MQLPIEIGLHRSRFLGVALVSIALLAGLVILFLPWPALTRSGALFFIAVAAGLAWRRLEPALQALRLEQTGHILVAPAGHAEFIEAAPLPGATVHPWLTVVRLKTQDGRTHPLIVAVDSMKPEDFRRLRVFLRWRADFSVPAGDA
ncbi:protein YgfX [Dechloromonas sp. H13]|uniref:protein YgfX n=1 Tax=Dechloromonas sp. H13 TaxID=2570193 RepID=UPI0012919F09|nr:protein YgfX [Dechloromonas sp. H13]